MRNLGHCRHTLLLAGGLLALLTVGTASAAPLVLYRIQSSRDPIGSVKEQMQDRLGFGESQLTRVVPLVRYAFDGATVWPLGGEVQHCRQGRHPDLEAAITDAETALDALEFARASSVLEPLMENLACAGAGATADRLARASLLLGYARFQVDDRDGAASAFEQAAAFQPDIEWDGTYPPDAQQVFNTAVLRGLRRDPIPVTGPVDGVTVDGAPLPDDRTLRPGWHLLALPRGGEGAVRLAVRLEPGGRLQIGETARMVDELFEGGRGFTPTMAALRVKVEADGDPETYLVDPVRSRILRFFGGSGELREIPGTGVADEDRDDRGNGRGQGDDDDDDGDTRRNDDPEDRGASRVAGGLRKPVKLGLGIGGGAMLLGGMGIAVATPYTYAGSCNTTTGSLPLWGLIPFAGPFMLYNHWSQAFGRDCYESTLRYFPLAMTLTVVEAVGAALLVIALVAPLEKTDGARAQRGSTRPMPLLLPSFGPDGDASIVLHLRF